MVVRFSGPEYDGFAEQLGDLDVIFEAIADDQAARKLGKQALLNPSVVELTPIAFDLVGFEVHSWHEAGARGATGVLQRHEFELELVESDEPDEDGAAFLVTPDEVCQYPLTSKQHEILGKIVDYALEMMTANDAWLIEPDGGKQ